MNQLTSLRRLLFLTPLIFGNAVLAAAQPDSIYKLPAGTHMRLKMVVELSSKVASVNDTFTATVEKPVTIRDTVVVPVGSVVEGRVTKLTRASAGAQNGILEVVFETLKLEGLPPRRIDARLVRPLESDPSSQVASVLGIVGGSAVGAVIGGLTGSGRGALIGAGIGAGIGASAMFLRKGKETRIRKYEEFEIELKSEVTLPVSDY